MLGRTSSLDNNYTVLGRVVAGMDAVDAIAPGEPPADPTSIVRAWLGDARCCAQPVVPPPAVTTPPPAPTPSWLMRVELFDFDLPTDRIALRPARPRDSARLLRCAAARSRTTC